ncbi:hypothetical protein KZX70_06445 [Paenibacillus silvae]|nr:hypothetical protein [Paenibacillus silvae]MCK6266337.1 hypothetical protein [Paenibacillus silvae]
MTQSAERLSNEGIRVSRFSYGNGMGPMGGAGLEALLYSNLGLFVHAIVYPCLCLNARFHNNC